MTTTAELTTTLASALGLPRRLAEETARHLREAKMLPGGEDSASIKDGVTLLLGLMAAPTPADAPDCARLYRQLPLDRATRAELTADDRWDMFEICDHDPVMHTLHNEGGTFGRFLTLLVEAAGCESAIEPYSVALGGGPGTATGAVGLNIRNPGNPVSAIVKFTLAPLGGGRRPDDAPRARLDCSATVPGSIFEVLHELCAVDSDGAQKNLPSRPTVAHEAGQSR